MVEMFNREEKCQNAPSKVSDFRRGFIRKIVR